MHHNWDRHIKRMSKTQYCTAGLPLKSVHSGCHANLQKWTNNNEMNVVNRFWNVTLKKEMTYFSVLWQESKLEFINMTQKKTAEHGIPALWFTTIKTILNTTLCKRNCSTVFWDSKHMCVNDYLEAGSTVISVWYIETWKHLRRRVCCVQQPWSRQFYNTVMLSHTQHATAKALVELKFEPIPYPPYSPDLAPCDFLFSAFKEGY